MRIGMGPTRANAAGIGMGPTRANAAGIGTGSTRAAAGLGRRVPLAFGGGWPRRPGCGRFDRGRPCAARGSVCERPGYVTIRGLDGFRGNAPRDAGKQVKGHQARAQGARRPPRGGTSRLSAPLEGGRRQARHLLPRPKDRHLRERVLLASLPLLRPAGPQEQRRVLEREVRPKPRARQARPGTARGRGLDGARGVGVPAQEGSLRADHA